ncbi:hypothetical protein AB0M46_31385 [Dactylosporangium sp. NPDC051485]
MLAQVEIEASSLSQQLAVLRRAGIVTPVASATRCRAGRRRSHAY